MTRCGKASPSPKRASPPTPSATAGRCSAMTLCCVDAIRLNLLTDRVDIVRDLGWRRNTSALTDTDVKYLLLYFEQNYGLTSERK